MRTRKQQKHYDLKGHVGGKRRNTQKLSVLMGSQCLCVNQWALAKQKITSRIFLVVQDNQGLTYAHATAITGMPHFNHKRHFLISMSECNYTMFKFWTTLAFPWACTESLCVFILFPSLCDISVDSRCLCCPSWFPCICVLYAWFSIHWCSMKLCYTLPKGLWETMSM